MREVKKGEMYYADLSPVVGSEQGGIRPVIILQNDKGNHYSPTTIIASVTSRKKKSHLPTHIKNKNPQFKEKIRCNARTGQNDRQKQTVRVYWEIG